MNGKHLAVLSVFSMGLAACGPMVQEEWESPLATQQASLQVSVYQRSSSFTTDTGATRVLFPPSADTSYFIEGGTLSGYIRHTFTAQECGGVLPDSGHVGVLSTGRACCLSDSWEVFQPHEQYYPGVRFRIPHACTCPAGSGQYAVMIYFRR